jgi:hypothetical protein
MNEDKFKNKFPLEKPKPFTINFLGASITVKVFSDGRVFKQHGNGFIGAQKALTDHVLKQMKKK